jgi:ankyrin repeat protein
VILDQELMANGFVHSRSFSKFHPFFRILSMARKKAQRKQETTLVPHRTRNLSALLERATFGHVRDLQAYLDAGGSATALVDLTAESDSIQVPLLHAVVIVTQHPHPGLAERIALLVRAGAELEALCSDGDTSRKCTAVALACAKGCCVPLLALLQNGADVNRQCDSDGSKPLHRAAAAGNVKHCTALIAHGAHVNAVNLDGNTPLHLAAQAGHAGVMTYLIKTAGADVNASNNTGIAPLHYASIQGHAAAVAVLVANGADPAVQCTTGRTALYCAVCGGHMFLVKHFFLKHGLALSADVNGGTLLMAAANCGHVDVAEWLIQQNLAVNAVSSDGETALHHAVRGDAADVVELLLAHGAAVDAQTGSCITPLMIAVSGGFTECARALIANGADVKRCDEHGLTCLHRAVQSCYRDMVQLLLSGGAVAVINALGIESADADCMTALMMCTDTAITQLLLDAGADVHETTGTGDTCLHVAAAHKHPVPVLCLLIKAGADIHAINDDGQTAAEVAHDYGNELAEQLLLRAARV